MADYDRRPRRGGGHFNNSRKRRYRDDDFEDRRPQRRRYEEPLAVTVRKTMLTIAEPRGRRVEDDVPYIAKTIADNYFDSDLTSGFVDLVLQMTIEQPLKIPFVAAVVLFTNTQKPDFIFEILKKVSDALQKDVDTGSWRNVKLYMRLLGSLQTLFEGDGIFPLLEQFFERAADLQMQSSEDSLGLELVKIILLTIPYTMASPATGLDGLASALLEKTDVIASTPHALESLVDPFPNFAVSSSTSSESALSLLQKHMQEEAKTSWSLSCLPRPWNIPKVEGEDDPLSTASKHPFPSITLPTTILSGPHPIYPEIYFSVYSDQDTSTVPPPSDPSALLIRDALLDTITALDFNRSEAARLLIDINQYFADGTFVAPRTAFDQMKETTGDRVMWKPEDVAVDACFAVLFTLPAPEHKLIYYHSVLTEACKLAPQAVAPSLGRAIRFLYRNIEQMDVEMSYRFLDWFAHHLSNFGFTWKWTEWVEDVPLPDVHPKKAFILDALDKEMRLSFAQRIKGTLPPEVADFIGVEREKDVPDFKFNDESVKFSEEGREIAKLIRQKAGKEELIEVLGQVDGKSDQVDVFVTTVSSVGSKSLSHFLAVVERTRDVFLELLSGGGMQQIEAEKQVVKSVLDFWRHQLGTGVVAVDKLVNYLIITPETVIEVVLGDFTGWTDTGRVLAKGWAYEILDRIIGKVVGRVKGVVTAYRTPGLEDSKREEIKALVDQEISKFKALIDLITVKIDQIADLVNAGPAGLDGMTDDERALVSVWCDKWRFAIKRKGEVEEQWVREELIKPIPPPPPPGPANGNGTGSAPGAQAEVDAEPEYVPAEQLGRDGDVGMNLNGAATGDVAQSTGSLLKQEDRGENGAKGRQDDMDGIE